MMQHVWLDVAAARVFIWRCCHLGAGPRKCIGYKFALEEAVITLAQLYRRFTFRCYYLPLCTTRCEGCLAGFFCNTGRRTRLYSNLHGWFRRLRDLPLQVGRGEASAGSAPGAGVGHHPQH